MSKMQVILLPGLMCDREVWQHQMYHLSHLAEFIIPDLSHADTPQAMVDAVLAVAPRQFALAGHSMGGWVAMEVAKRVPERISKLCLIDTSADGDAAEKKSFREKMLARALQGDFSIVDEFTQMFVSNKNVKDNVRAMLQRNKDAFIKQEKALIARESSLEHLARVPCPTLIIHAIQDTPYPPEHAERMLARLPDAKLALIDGSGHMVTMEMPEAVTAFMRYWLMYF